MEEEEKTLSSQAGSTEFLTKQERRDQEAYLTPQGDREKVTQKSPVLEAEEGYKSALLEARNLYESGLITSKGLKDAESEAAQAYQRTVAKLLGDGAKALPLWSDAEKRIIPQQTAYERILQDHNSTACEYTNRLQRGTLTLEEYDKQMARLLTDTTDRLSAEERLTDAEREEVARLRASREQFVATPQMPERDKTFDYKKTPLDIQREDLERLKEYARLLEESIALGSKESEQLLLNAKAKASSLEEVIRLETVRKDLADLQDKKNVQTYQGIKSIADATRGATQALKRMRSVFDDDDSTGLEKLFSIFSSITSVVDSILSLVNAFKTLSATMEAVEAASEALDAVQQATQATSIAVSTAEVAASTALASAKMAEMASIISARYAAIPGGEALAAAEIASYAALIKGVKGLGAFAHGGLVDFGSPVGDRTLIRVNRGERVLTSEQQEWLQGLSKGFQTDEKQSVRKIEITGQFKLHGRDLVAAINNEVRRSRR